MALENKKSSSPEDFDLVKQVSQDIADLSEYLKNLFSFFPVPTAILTPLGVIIEINPAFEKISGYTAKEILGESIYKFFGEKTGERIVSLTLKKGGIKDKEYTLYAKNKKRIPVSVSTRVREDEEGNPAGLFLSVIDLRRIKRINERLEEANIVLEIRVRARTRRIREFVEQLENLVEERTKELNEKLRDLERFQKVARGREERLRELQEENRFLKEKLKELERSFVK